MWNKRNLIYTSKVWGLSWILTPFVLFVFAVITEIFTSNDSISKIILDDHNIIKLNMVQVFLLVYGVSFICSLPYGFLLWPINSLIDKLEISPINKKIIFTLSAITLLHLLFSIVNQKAILSLEGLPWYLSITFGIWYFKIGKRIEQEEQNPSLDDHLVV